MTENNKFRKEAEQEAIKQQKIQQQIDRAEKKEASKKSKKKEEPMQAGARKYPEPPVDKQHLSKPGKEKDLAVKPMCDAPYYKGSGKLLDKVAIITGADSGIGKSVAILFAREGADISVVYLNGVECLAEMCRLVLDETGLLPHANAGALGVDDLARLRPVAPSQGMMVESLRVDLAAHRGSPDKTP